MSVTAPKSGTDARVGREMGSDVGYFIRRVKRVEEYLQQPVIMDLADQVARHVEKWAAVERVAIAEVEPSLIPTQTMRYVTVYFGARPCYACGGSGEDRSRLPHGRCDTCQGTGVR